MQIFNNLQIPLEVVISKEQSEPEPDQEDGSSLIDKNYIGSHMNFEMPMFIKPEQSMVIPLRACNFTNI